MTAKTPNYLLKKFYWKDYLMIFLGTFMYSLGITQFIMPHKFVTGGLAGVGVLLNYAFAFPVSVTVLVVNGTLESYPYLHFWVYLKLCNCKLLWRVSH